MPRLPPVDPDYLIDERDPEKLDGYARGLWEHLQNVRAGASANGYPIATIKAATVWLLERYIDANEPPPYELGRLVSELIKPNPRQSTSPVQARSEAAYWTAIKYEAAQQPDPKGELPSKASNYAIAKHVRESLASLQKQDSVEATIRGWRQTPHYRDQVSLQRDPAAHFRAMRDRIG